jgi:hypothetical protein
MRTVSKKNVTQNPTKVCQDKQGEVAHLRCQQREVERQVVVVRQEEDPQQVGEEVVEAPQAPQSPSDPLQRSMISHD